VLQTKVVHAAPPADPGLALAATLPPDPGLALAATLPAPQSLAALLEDTFARAQRVAATPIALARISLGEIDAHAARKMSDEVRLRRAHLAKYVKGVVSACVVVCMIALVRKGMASSEQESPRPPAVVAAHVTPVTDPPVAVAVAAPVPEATPAPDRTTAAPPSTGVRAIAPRPPKRASHRGASPHK
jgi:hypothetical protein